MTTQVATHPVQVKCAPYIRSADACVPVVVSMKAYEVYCHVHGAQPAMVTGACRGGFSAGEIIAFLYAHTFPKAEWSARVDEAFRGMRQL